MNKDIALLKQYAKTKDADAFASLVDRHSGLVYRATLRVTGDAHLAEYVAQECFLELARRAHAVRESLPAWLHLRVGDRSKTALRGRTPCWGIGGCWARGST